MTLIVIHKCKFKNKNNVKKSVSIHIIMIMFSALQLMITPFKVFSQNSDK